MFSQSTTKPVAATHSATREFGISERTEFLQPVRIHSV